MTIIDDIIEEFDLKTTPETEVEGLDNTAPGTPEVVTWFAPAVEGQAAKIILVKANGTKGPVKGEIFVEEQYLNGGSPVSHQYLAWGPAGFRDAQNLYEYLRQEFERYHKNGDHRVHAILYPENGDLH